MLFLHVFTRALGSGAGLGIDSVYGCKEVSEDFDIDWCFPASLLGPKHRPFSRDSERCGMSTIWTAGKPCAFVK